MNLSAVSRVDRLLLGIVLVVAMLTGLATWLLRPPEKTGGLIELPSTFYNAGYGTKASYLAIDRLGFPVARLRRPLVPETLDGIGTLFILKPWIGLGSHELTELEDWIKDGHALVVAPGSCLSSRADPGCFGAWFHLTEVAEDDASEGRSDGDSGKKPNASIGGKSPPGNAEMDAAEPIVAGVRELTADGNVRFRAASPCGGPFEDQKPRVFWKDRRGALGLRVNFGKGEVIALADAYPFSNFGLGRADNGLLLGNIVQQLSQRYPGRIAFDEYHLGFPQRDWTPLAIVELMLAGNWRWAVIQVLVVGLLALAAGAVRFGSPQGVTRKPRRQHREFAEAAGRLLDEGRATALAAETLGRHYRGRLCRLAFLEPEADDQRLASAVRSRSGLEIAGVLEEARNAAAVPVSRQKLLTISKELYHIVEALAHGT
jgi:hypothetical protein